MQPGECLIRSPGTNVTKIQALTQRAIQSEDIINRESMLIVKNPAYPHLVIQDQSANLYEKLKEKPRAMYADLVRSIIKHTD